MTVYADEIRDYGDVARSRGLPNTRWCHLTADTREELHVLAGRVGLRRAWFQDHEIRWHYDATPGVRVRAIKAGALEITYRELAGIMTARRAALAPACPPVPFGLHVVSGTDPGNPWRRAGKPSATFACRCGEYRQAAGETAVTALSHGAAGHREICPLVTPRPCQHCGASTRSLSCGLTGYPACPACRDAWEARPVEQRRRESAAKAIGARENMRRKARKLREQLEREGHHPDVIDAIISGGMLPAPDEETGE